MTSDVKQHALSGVGSGRPAMWEPFARELTRRVVSGEYAEADLTPTETQLGDEFTVSRTVVREGMRVLAERGLVTIQRGRGTIVMPRGSWHSFDPDVLAARLEYGDRAAVLREVLTLRRVVEPELAAGAATNADELALARLGARMDDLLLAQDDPVRYLEVDQDFHRCIAEIAGISLLAEIMRVLEQPVRIQRSLTSHIPGGSPHMSQVQHLAIFKGIIDRDAEAARVAMRLHLEWAEARLGQILGDDAPAADNPWPSPV